MDDGAPNKEGLDIEKAKKLLKLIFEQSAYTAGSIHQNANLVDLVNLADEMLFQKNYNSVHIIIDKNANNSLDITINKVE
jgi:hypothetical protein